jgi:cytochrome P450
MRTHSATITQRPPGPRAYPIIGALPQVFRDPLHFFGHAAERYGDVVALGNNWYALLGPDEIAHTLQKNHTNYVKGHATEPVKLMTGAGILTSENPLWLQQRRLIQPAFHHRRINAMAQTMVTCTARMLDSWTEAAAARRPIDIAAAMVGLSIDIVGQTLFGGDLTVTDTRAFHQTLISAIAFVTRRAQSPVRLPITWPLPAHRQFRRHMQALDTIVLNIIDKRRRRTADTDDLLALLLEARDADTGEQMSDRQLRDEIMTLFLAGHDTAAQTLSWVWYLLEQHPAVYRRLVAEVRAVVGNRTPTAEDVQQLTYTWMVLQEVMRMYPPAWLISRSPLAPDTIGDYTVPAGAVLLLSLYGLHRNPRVWADPGSFNPDRFAPDQASMRHPFAYMPFGAGPRICIGNRFAMLEMIITLTMIIQRYDVALVADHPIEPEPLTVLRPKHGVKVTLTLR